MPLPGDADRERVRGVLRNSRGHSDPRARVCLRGAGRLWRGMRRQPSVRRDYSDDGGVRRLPHARHAVRRSLRQRRLQRLFAHVDVSAAVRLASAPGCSPS
jgi:hypothetical protein